MNNKAFNLDRYLIRNSRSLKDYVQLIRSNLKSFIIIASVIIVAAAAYALLAKRVYKSTVTLKIITGKQSILDSQDQNDVNTMVNDRYIANEIDVINNYDSRENYSKALIDSFNVSRDKSIFSVIRADDNKGINGHQTVKDLAETLNDIISANQIPGLDVVEISAESPSPYEAALIANTCANVYKEMNLENNRKQLTTIRKFLENQTKEKLQELNSAEENLKNFRQRGGIIALDAQSNALINQLASLDAQRDAAKVDLMTSNEILSQYKKELKNQDPQLADYLETQASQTYIDALQKQIADLQMNKDLAMANKDPKVDVSSKLKEYDQKMGKLKQKLNSMISDVKAGAFSSSPEQIKELSQKLVGEQINNNSLSIKLNELQNIINGYEQNFNRLPKKSLEMAQYERKIESLQQVYSLVEKKYQEAFINELSQPGNAVIINKGRVPDKPYKPNKILIGLIGLIAGFVFAFGFILVKDYFDDTIKTPDDIDQKSYNLLAWVPHLKEIGTDEHREYELLSSENADAALIESFKSVRARLQFTNHNSTEVIKRILITSPLAKEGKTVVAVNLAASFAQSNKRTLLIDCDLRRPRIHSLMKDSKSPGLVEFLYHGAKFEDIIRKSVVKNLYFITAGEFSKNSDQVLASTKMKIFLEEISDLFDIVIIDSAPIIPVIDSQILSRLVDGTILVVAADSTNVNLMTNAIDMLKKAYAPFLGIVLNNFRYKNGYSNYYSYYYSSSPEGNRD